MLQKQSSGRLGQRIQWTAQSRDTVDRLRSSLETQKSALEIALQCGSLQILFAMQRQVGKSGRDVDDIIDDTKAILGSPEAIPRDAVDITELICQEANALRAEIASLQNAKALSVELREFLVESQLYLKSVTNPFTTPEPSESGLPEARSSIVWTHDMHDNLIDLDISDEDRSTASNPRDWRDATTTNAGPKAMPSFSALSIGAIEVVMRYGGLTASHSFSSDMVYSVVMAWAYEELITASKEDRIRLN